MVAYSCNGRGVCLGCNTLREVETVAHMVEHLFPAVAVRQWVVVFPMRLRYFLNIDAGCLNRAAGIAMREVPRLLSTPFWMGRPLGRAGDGETQRRTLLAALEPLVTI